LCQTDWTKKHVLLSPFHCTIEDTMFPFKEYYRIIFTWQTKKALFFNHHISSSRSAREK
jgi:hypothetical protein